MTNEQIEKLKEEFNDLLKNNVWDIRRFLVDKITTAYNQGREDVLREVVEMKESLADLEHDRWAKWQKYLHSKLDFSTGKYVLSESDFEHWNRQIHTPYSELSEKEKDSDRIEAQKTIDLILSTLSKEDKTEEYG